MFTQTCEKKVALIVKMAHSCILGGANAPFNVLTSFNTGAARLISDILKYYHITPVLKELHWLPVYIRTEYKVILINYKALNDAAPKYGQPLMTHCSFTALGAIRLDT